MARRRAQNKVFLPEEPKGPDAQRLAILGELSAVVAHEFRNSLGALENVFALLRHDMPQRGDTPQLFVIAHEEIERMNALITDLLDFGRPVAPSMVFTNLERLLDGAARAARAKALLRDIFVDVLLPPDLPDVPLDPRLLHQALLNLARNGIDAMPSGGRLTLGAELRDEKLHLYVDDEGTGISDDMQARIFEPFFTTKTSGVGLGLTLVRRIAEQHHGQVRVERRAPRGTRMVITIPIRVR